MAKSVTLAEIAKKSRLSLSTVSLALRDKPGISADTRRQVRDTAVALGYRPRQISSGHTHRPNAGKLQNLGLVVKTEPELTPQANPFYSLVLAGIEDACRRRNTNLLYATLPVDENNRPTDIPRLLLDGQVDGVLLVGAYVDEMVARALGEQARPIVLVDAYAALEQYDAVLSDNCGGAYEAVRALAARGHTHIGVVGGGAAAYPSLRERREGYLKALCESGLPRTYLADCRAGETDEAVAALLQQHPQITALFACNDHMAIRAMRAAEALGRNVPDSLAVMGFDDIDHAQHISPTLSTMHVDKVGMGRIAVQMLANRVQFPEAERVTTVLRPRLVERESTSQPVGVPA
jgi:LacI family transcriptional regulator